MKPIVHGLEPRWQARDVTFVAVNVDEPDGRQYAEDMQVDGIPRFEFYRGGKVVAEALGYQKAEQLEANLEKIASAK